MTFHAALSRAAAKSLDGLDRPTQQRLRSRIRQITAGPFDPRMSKPLAQLGSWRIIFVVNLTDALVEVLSIESRGQVYRGL